MHIQQLVELFGILGFTAVDLVDRRGQLLDFILIEVAHDFRCNVSTKQHHERCS